MTIEKDTCFCAALNVYIGGKIQYALTHKEFIAKQMTIQTSKKHRIFYVTKKISKLVISKIHVKGWENS